MNKKFLSLVLALVMVLGTFGSVFAAEAPKADAKKDTKVEETKKVPEKKDNNEKVQWLVDNEIVLGRKMYKDEKNNDLALDKNIQRAEITKLLVYAIGRQDLATKIHGQVKPYSDVKNDHWANGFITVGTTMASPKNALPFLHGYVDGSFKPENDVTYVELAKMLVVLVKDDLTQADFKTAVWPRDWMAWAAQLGILDGVKVEDSSKAAVREDAFVMLYNALYKLGELRNLPAHETMGIISAASANKITLNQGDLKKEFTVDASTNFVPANYSKKDRATSQEINWLNVVNSKDEKYYIGSLVRVLADDKGNVSHIVQLGNPIDLALYGNGWEGVAQNTIETGRATKAVLVDRELDTIKFEKGAIINDGTTLTKDEVSVDTNSKTRYFVADYAKKQLTEVKDADAALKLFDRDTKKIEKVYVGYDLLKRSGVKEAKVVVFGVVDKDNWDSNVVRIVTAGTNSYKVTAQESGYRPTDKKAYDLKAYKAAFPLNYNLNPYDVVELAEDMTVERLIDYKTADVFKIADIEYEQLDRQDKVNGRVVVLTLEDQDGTQGELEVPVDADLFFGNELVKGAKVQIKLEAGKNNLAEVVSVIPKETDLKGYLPAAIKDAKYKDQKDAEFVGFEATEKGFHVRVKLIDNNGVSSRVTTYLAPASEKAALEALVSGQKIVFNDLGIKDAQYTKADSFKGADLRAAAKDTIAKFTDLEENEKTAAEKAVEEAKSVADLEKAVKDAKDLNDVNAVAKEIKKVVLPKGATIDEATVKANLPTNKKDVKVEFVKLDTATAGSEKVDLKLTKGEAEKTATGIAVEVEK